MESKVVYDVFHLVYWDWRIPMDLFLGGIAVGAFLFGILVMFTKKDDSLVMVKVGSLLGPILMSFGMLFLLSELGAPMKMYKTITRFNLTSTLSWGGVLQMAFIGLSAIFAAILLTKKKPELITHFAILGGLFAVLVGFYHSFLLSFVTARPLWNAGASSLVSITTFVNTGIAAVLLFSAFSEKGRSEISEMSPAIKKFLLCSLLAHFTAAMLWIVSLMHGKADFVKAYDVLNEQFGALFWIGSVVVGLFVPFVFLAVTKKDKMVPVYLVSIPILFGGYAFRYVLILAGQLS